MKDRGVLAIVAYRPLPGKEALLLELTRDHLPVLRSQGLATERPSLAMRASDGTVIEVFEWKSKDSIEAAHTNPAVQTMWGKYQEACEYTPLARIRECSDLFAGFEPIDL